MNEKWLEVPMQSNIKIKEIIGCITFKGMIYIILVNKIHVNLSLNNYILFLK
jgi:hypothetical protein